MENTDLGSRPASGSRLGAGAAPVRPYDLPVLLLLTVSRVLSRCPGGGDRSWDSGTEAYPKRSVERLFQQRQQQQ